MSHLTEIKVRGYHLDLYGHVNNARYLEFLEEARWSFIEDRGDLNSFMNAGLSFVVVNININYRYPAFLGDVLQIETSLKKQGEKSAILHQQIKFKGKEKNIADADVTFVIVDAKTEKVIPIGENIKKYLPLEK